MATGSTAHERTRAVGGLADWVQRIQLWLAAPALVILMMVTVVDVFMRYLFNRPIRASLDTVEVMLLVFVFNGMAAAFFGRRHIVIDLLDGVFGAAHAPRVLIRIADCPVGALSRAARLGDAAAGDAGVSVRRLQDGAADPDLRALDRRAGELRRHDLLRAGHAGGEAGRRPSPGTPNESAR